MDQALSFTALDRSDAGHPRKALRSGRGDHAAGNPDLIIAHMSLVRRIAASVHHRIPSTDVADLRQIGMMALVEAARDYEDRGHAFATYATMRIRGAMIDSTRRSALVSRKAIAQRRTIEAARASLENGLGRRACAAEMASSLAMPIEEFLAMENASAGVVVDSLDDVYSDSAVAFIDETPLAETCLIQREVAALLAAHIAALPEREAMVMQLYFVEELPLKDIGDLLGVGAARICQIKRSALAALKEAMAPALVD